MALVRKEKEDALDLLDENTNKIDNDLEEEGQGPHVIVSADTMGPGSGGALVSGGN